MKQIKTKKMFKVTIIMTQALNKLFTFIEKYIFIFLGLILFLLFIWFRFIRTRLPKDIPFIYLSAKGFIILVFICIIYILILKALIKPNSRNNLFLEYIVPRLYLPLESFDKFLKESINKEKVILSLKNKLSFFIKDTNIFYSFFAIIPRLILVTVLVIDVFYFHKLHYIYYFIYLAILIFINKYIIYSFKTEKKRLIEKIKPLLMNESVGTSYVMGVHPEEDPEDEDYDPFMPTMSLPLEVFLDFHTRCFIYEKIHRDYWFSPSDAFYSTFNKKYNLSENFEYTTYYLDLIQEEKENIIKPQINKIIELGHLIEYYNITHHHNKVFKRIKIMIFSLYLICWTYILIRSIPNFSWLSAIELLLDFSRTINDPFINEVSFIPFTKELIDIYEFLLYSKNV